MHAIDCDPEQMLGDNGYDSRSVRHDIERRGGQAKPCAWAAERSVNLAATPITPDVQSAAGFGKPARATLRQRGHAGAPPRT